MNQIFPGHQPFSVPLNASPLAMCFGSRPRDDEVGAARSRELDKMIRADEKRMTREVKLLLLGMVSHPLQPAPFPLGSLDLWIS